MIEQLDLFPKSNVLRTERFSVMTRHGQGVVTAEVRLPYYDTIITAAPWDGAVGLNWGRFMREFRIDKWEEIT